MTVTATHNSQRRNIQVYLLAAPEDQDIYEGIEKHLSPIVKNSPIPIEVNSDFNIPSGADRTKYKHRLFDADVVLALISVDFINNDDIYGRNQKVIERYNNQETVMIPILVRNCMWKATPFSSLPVLPKNLQPLNNKQFWNSPDDAVTAVASDIYDSINELAQSKAVQPSLAVEEVESASEFKATSETSQSQTTSQPGATSAEDEAVQPSSAAKMESTPDHKATSETPISPTELYGSINESTQSEAVQPSSAAKVESTPDLKAISGTLNNQTMSQARESSSIAVDWRIKYYRTVAMKRFGAIFLDQLIFVFIPIFLLGVFDKYVTEGLINLYFFFVLIIYFVVNPIMESSKWQGTIGKRILKLQITNREGDRISFLQALWRNIIRTIALYLYSLTFGTLLILQYFRFRKTKKLFHDELSNTIIGERLASSSVTNVTKVAGNVA